MNGRGFDLPVMEMAAFRYGIAFPGWFFVHLRLAVLRGKVRADEEHERVEEAHKVIEAHMEEYPGLSEYLEKFRYWAPSGADDDGML